MGYSNKRILGVIPSRYASTRFPAKALARVGDLEMVVCVCKRVIESGLFDKVVVATDSRRIFDTVISYGYNAIMTDSSHCCGSERVEQALRIIEEQEGSFDIVVNIQGDEPLINSEHLESVIKPFDDDETEISTLCKMIEDSDTLLSANTVKVVFDNNHNAMYFSRSIIPYSQGETIEYTIAKGMYFKHIGLYAYRPSVLKELVKLYVSNLERVEVLEQLRWLEQGYKIRVSITDFESIGVDTPEDLERVNREIIKNN